MIDKLINKTKRLMYRAIPDWMQYSIYKRRMIDAPEKWIDAHFYIIHVPKCAGVSIASSAGIRDPGHILLEDVPQSVREKLLPKPMIAVVREPCSRIISTFQFMHRVQKAPQSTSIGFANTPDINVFVQSSLTSKRVSDHYFFWPCARYVKSAQRCGAMVTTVDFSSLGDGFVSFLSKNNIPNYNLPKKNFAPKNKSPEIIIDLDNKSKEIIRNLYSEDYEEYFM